MSMRLTFRAVIASISLTFACALPGAGLASAASPPATGKIVKHAITFQVKNVNHSILPCASDGAAYEVRGHLIGPASEIGPSAPAGHHSVTLYLHDFEFGEFFWSFSAVPRYDYAAAMARAGHVSVVVDRLGYGSSGRPQGDRTCLGSAADVAHQIVGDLRSGDYDVQGGESRRFDKVALGGHFVGALIANLEAFSFNDVDGLVAISYTPNVTYPAFEDFYNSRAVCDRGGEPLAPGGPSGYVHIAETDAQFEEREFYGALHAVRAAATRMRTLDPCGDGGSVIDALVQDLKSFSQVKIPVLLVCGREDAVVPSFACPVLKQRYRRSSDVSLSFIPNAGHAVTLERSAPILRQRVGTWLTAHGF